MADRRRQAGGVFHRSRLARGGGELPDPTRLARRAPDQPPFDVRHVDQRQEGDLRGDEVGDGGGRETPVEVRRPLVQAKVRELVAAGGTVLREDSIDGVPDHVVMADPEGNEFCVI
ncbi:VOC family protein [Saccharothrix sp.]|uniref:VOC family protein n=1 Tax=Saccharothrix sp. TaxID=1873460 RepID=UPI0028118121|nr:VOC family protein [Saccharothrix sp.]